MSRIWGQAKCALDPALLRMLLHYDPETGELVWRERSPEMFGDPHAALAARAEWWNGRYAGKPAITALSKGYRRGWVLSTMVPAHRVAWAIHHGRWPDQCIDHINGVRHDNRIANLREVSERDNHLNVKRYVVNKSGIVGVCRVGKVWIANIKYRGRQIHLGRFATKEAAAIARKAAERRFGFHENHGREG